MTVAKTHFELKDNVAKDFIDAGVVVSNDGRSVSLAALLEKGKGTISTEDPAEIDAFDNHRLLKRVSAPSKGSKPAAKKDDNGGSE